MNEENNYFSNYLSFIQPKPQFQDIKPTQFEVQQQSIPDLVDSLFSSIYKKTGDIIEQNPVTQAIARKAPQTMTPPAGYTGKSYSEELLKEAQIAKQLKQQGKTPQEIASVVNKQKQESTMSNLTNTALGFIAPEKEIGKSTISDILKFGAGALGTAGAAGVLSKKNKFTVTNTNKEKSIIPSSKLASAIAETETNVIPESKRYSFSQPSGIKSLGRAMGKYQVTEGELRDYSKLYTGRKITSKQFLSNPKIQDEYMIGKINYLRSKGMTDEEIIAAHRGGLNADTSSSTIKDYIEKTLKNLQQ